MRLDPNFVKNNKGLSAVIVTLLLVMLSIVLVGVVFVTINNIVKSGTSQVALSSECLSSHVSVVSFSCTQTGSDCNVTIKRTLGSEPIYGARIIFTSSDGNSNTSDMKGNIPTLTTKSSGFKNIGLSDINSVQVLVLFPKSSGNPAPCSIVSDQLSGSIGSNGLITGGTGSSSGSSSSTTSTILCTPATDPTLSGVCGSYTCGSVNNGTCGTVSCGASCPTGQSCDLNSSSPNYNTCQAVSASCAPISNPSTYCSSKGYTCGSVNNGTCGGTIGCGICGTGKYCDLTTHNCVDTSTCSPAPADFCSIHHYTCGQFNNGTCGGTIYCGLSRSTTTNGCNAPQFCNSTYQCQSPYIVNSGTIDSVYPSGAARFFSSESLPKSQTADDALTSSAYYIYFPSSSEKGCTEMLYVQYMPPPKNESFVSLSLGTGDSVNVTASNQYQIWNTKDGCLNAAGLL